MSEHKRIAQLRWPGCGEIYGEGLFAAVGWCCMVPRVSLHPTHEKAIAMRDKLDEWRCGNRCHGKGGNHHVYQFVNGDWEPLTFTNDNGGPLRLSRKTAKYLQKSLDSLKPKTPRNVRSMSDYKKSVGDACEACGWVTPASVGSSVKHVHHVLPVTRGGLDEPDNLLSLCPNCHSIAHKLYPTGMKKPFPTKAELHEELQRIAKVPA